MKVELEKNSENLQTSILAIMQMTPKNREKFYASEAGRDIVKGLFLEAEQDKKAKADGMNWTEDDIERTIIALRNASEDDFKIFLQLLPGPIQGRISEHFKKERQNNGLSPTVIEKGARIGSAGYELWLAKRRQHSNVAHSDLNKPMSGGSKTPKAPKPVKPAKAPKGPKTPKPIGYGKFIAKKPKKD
jgi:hypothetical protein